MPKTEAAAVAVVGTNHQDIADTSSGRRVLFASLLFVDCSPVSSRQRLLDAVEHAVDAEALTKTDVVAVTGTGRPSPSPARMQIRLRAWMRRLSQTRTIFDSAREHLRRRHEDGSASRARTLELIACSAARASFTPVKKPLA